MNDTAPPSPGCDARFAGTSVVAWAADRPNRQTSAAASRNRLERRTGSKGGELKEIALIRDIRRSDPPFPSPAATRVRGSGWSEQFARYPGDRPIGTWLGWHRAAESWRPLSGMR